MTPRELEEFLAKGKTITVVPPVVLDTKQKRRPRSGRWTKANAFKSGGLYS